MKKAISAATSAALLASLLATAVAPSALAASTITSQGVLFPWVATASAATLPADGLSSYTITFSHGTATDITAARISVTGGYFLSGTGAFATTNGLVGGTATTFPATSFLFTDTTVLNGTSRIQASTLTIASTAAGTAIFTIQYSSAGAVTPATGYDSSFGFTFTGSTSTSVSTSYSTTTAASSTVAAIAGTTDVITTTVADTNNSYISTGALVSWTLSGPAIFVGGYQVDSNNTTSSGGVATISIVSTGVSGAVTIATTVSYLGVSYTLANATVTFFGDVSKAVGSNNYYAIPWGLDTTTGSYPLDGDNDALSAKVTDAAGSAIGANVTFTFAFTPANIFTLATPTYDSTNKVWDFDATCHADGTATVVITANSTLSTDTASTSALTLTCSDQLTSTYTGTFTATASSASVAPNGTATVTVKVLDDNKLPAPDGTPVIAVTNGVGNVISSGGTVGSSTTSNGVATFTYLAPVNAGSATVTVFVSNAAPSSQSITFTIGAGVPGVTVGTAASALGVTMTGPFTKATKIPAKGKYVTVKLVMGAAAAGTTITIKVATKTGSTWSAFANKTTRIADASGNVYFYWKSASAAWLSIMAVGTNAVQVRWM